MDLHLITDTVLQSRFSHLDLARMAWEGGARHVQYRHKGFERSRDLSHVKAMAMLATKMDRVLIVNDDWQLALEVGAQGVHLGKGDGSPLDARKALGPQATIGATVHDLRELEAVADLPIDYVGIGPVYGTRSKSTGLPDLGLERLKALCAASPVPVVAIGGLHPGNITPVLETGVQGIAILSAFCNAPNPTQFVQALLQQFA